MLLHELQQQAVPEDGVAKVKLAERHLAKSAEWSYRVGTGTTFCFQSEANRAEFVALVDRIGFAPVYAGGQCVYGTGHHRNPHIAASTAGVAYLTIDAKSGHEIVSMVFGPRAASLEANFKAVMGRSELVLAALDAGDERFTALTDRTHTRRWDLNPLDPASMARDPADIPDAATLAAQELLIPEFK